MQDGQSRFTQDELVRLIAGIGQFLENECSDLCCDDEADRGTLSAKLAAWLLQDKSIQATPELMVPKATYKLAFNVVDEPTGEHIIRLTLDRSREMADGDFLQLQNFFWVTVGRAIRDNPEVIRTLQAAGVRVEIDPPAQPSPAEM
jgi:hypothetical protein